LLTQRGSAAPSPKGNREAVDGDDEPRYPAGTHYRFHACCLDWAWWRPASRWGSGRRRA